MGSPNSWRSRCISSSGAMQTYCVPELVRTVWTIPLEARRSSVE